MPKVSIIIPSYDHANYLQQRIESVLDQTFQDFELIILDDHSTDASKTIIEKYRGHPKVTHIVYNEINSGTTFKQWEKGIKLAEGKYIWIAESDDWCEPTFLETLYKGISDKEDCVVAFCQSYCTDGQKILWRSQSDHFFEYQDGKEFVSNKMIMGNSIFNASMAIWQKSYFDKISKQFMEFRFCGDWLFWIELCLCGEVFITAKMLNYFRKHDKDVSGNAYRTGFNFKEEIKLINILLDRKVITQTMYLDAMKEKYRRFERLKNDSDDLSIIALESDFFKTPAIKKYLLKKESKLKRFIVKARSLFK